MSDEQSDTDIERLARARVAALRADERNTIPDGYDDELESKAKAITAATLKLRNVPLTNADESAASFSVVEKERS